MSIDLLKPPEGGKTNGSRIGVDVLWKILTGVTLATVLWIGQSTVRNSIHMTENRADIDRNIDRTKDRYTRSEAHRDFEELRSKIDRLTDAVLEIERSRGGRNLNQELEKIAARLSGIEAKLGIQKPEEEPCPKQ